jgi:hypothetical protein
MVPVTVEVGSYCPRPASLLASIRVANSAKLWRFRTRGRLYLEDTILKRLAQNFQDMAAALGAFIQTQDAVMSPRHLARHGDVPADTQTHIRDGVMWGVTQCRRLSRLIPSQSGGHRGEVRS